MRNPRIYYYGYDHSFPVGGQKDTYQHVDILNRAGFDAYVAHTKIGYRLDWFENDTRIAYLDEIRETFDPSLDFMVAPEDIGPAIDELPGRKVIFNKNLFGGFITCGRRLPDYYDCQRPDVVAILTVSQHNRAHIEFTYPHVPVLLVDYDLRSEQFPFRALSSKRPVIACSPKAPKHILPVFHMIRSRGIAGLNRNKNFGWVVLENMSERQVASVLGEALLLVFLSIEEGLPRLPLEAMSSGCLIAAYGQGPLQEYLPKEYSFECGDILSVAQFIESVMNAYPAGLARFDEVTRDARRTAEMYSTERQESTVVQAWETILRLGHASR
jgi:glycosyltransferase involved in cell wall biosynthesis